MSGKYDDMLDLPHPDPQTHPRMPMRNRAAQFSAFAALTGHDAAIAETRRLTDQRIDLDENEIAQLDEKLRLLEEQIEEHLTVSITYFQPDARKDGGSYQPATGIIKRIDRIKGVIIFLDRREVSICEIVEVSADSIEMVKSR